MITALIPARSGSKRVPNKNVRDFHGYPLIAYSIAYALSSQLIDSVVVSSDSQETCEIALQYGAHNAVVRPKTISTEHSLDIEWIEHIDAVAPIENDFVALIRPTSPLRSLPLLADMWSFLEDGVFDSVRTIKLVKEHPGKMWCLSENGRITPFVNSKAGEIPQHAKQYASLPTIYVQTSVLEIFNVRSMRTTRTREGSNICGFVTTGIDSWAIDEVDEWDLHVRTLEQDRELRFNLHSMIERCTK